MFVVECMYYITLSFKGVKKSQVIGILLLYSLQHTFMLLTRFRSSCKQFEELLLGGKLEFCKALDLIASINFCWASIPESNYNGFRLSFFHARVRTQSYIALPIVVFSWIQLYFVIIPNFFPCKCKCMKEFSSKYKVVTLTLRRLSKSSFYDHNKLSKKLIILCTKVILFSMQEYLW